MPGSLSRIHIEDNAAGTSPAAILHMKNSAPVANRGHGCDSLHLASFDSFESNVHGRKRTDELIVLVRNDQHLRKPVTGNPAQPSGFSRLSCEFKEILPQFTLKPQVLSYRADGAGCTGN